MMGYQSSTGAIMALTGGGLQSSVSGGPCCCENNRCPGFDCSMQLIYCTGYKFLLPAVFVTISPFNQTYDYATEHPEFVSVYGPDSDIIAPLMIPRGEYAFGAAYPHNASAFILNVSWSLTISTIPTSHLQFYGSSGYGTGMYRKITCGAETHEFGGMFNSGADSSATVALSQRPIGDTSGTAIIREPIGGGMYRVWTETWSASETKTADEICEVIDIVYEAVTNADVDQVGLNIYASLGITKYIRVTGSFSAPWSTTADDGSNGGSGTVKKYGKSIVYMIAAARAEIRGSEVGVDVCNGETANWTHTGGFLGGVGKLEASNGVVTLLPPIPPAHLPELGFDYVSGTVNTSIGTGSGSLASGFDDTKVGCRSCERTLTFVFTRKVCKRISTSTIIGNDIINSIPEADRELVTQTWTADLFQGAVVECGMYGCEWSGSATITASGVATDTAPIGISRLGPNLYRFIPLGIVFKVGGSCPNLGAIEVRQDLNPRYVINSTYTDPSGLTGNLAAITDPDYALSAPFTQAISDYTITITASAAENTNEYYCDREVFYDTGREIAGGLDIRWEIETSNESGTYRLASLETTNEFFAYYATPLSGNGWIGQDAVSSVWTGLRNFRSRFYLQSTKDLAIDIASDNQTIALVVNGILVASNPTPNDNTSHEIKHRVNIPESATQLGWNIIVCTVRDNDDSPPHAAGFLAEWVRV